MILGGGGADFARAVVEYFVLRRGRGTTLSATDQQLVLEWESEGRPLLVVVQGIDDAFSRLREPPASLGQTRRWVNRRWKKWIGVEPDDEASAPISAPVSAPISAPESAPAAAWGVAPASDSGSNGSAGPDAAAASPRDMRDGGALASALHAREGAASHPCAKQAYAALAAEVREAVDSDGRLPEELVGVLDEALLALALSALDERERARVREAAEARIAGDSVRPSASDAARRERDRLAWMEVLSERIGISSILFPRGGQVIG